MTNTVAPPFFTTAITFKYTLLECCAVLEFSPNAVAAMTLPPPAESSVGHQSISRQAYNVECSWRCRTTVACDTYRYAEREAKNQPTKKFLSNIQLCHLSTKVMSEPTCAIFLNNRTPCSLTVMLLMRRRHAPCIAAMFCAKVCSAIFLNYRDLASYVAALEPRLVSPPGDEAHNPIQSRLDNHNSSRSPGSTRRTSSHHHRCGLAQSTSRTASGPVVPNSTTASSRPGSTEPVPLQPHPISALDHAHFAEPAVHSPRAWGHQNHAYPVICNYQPSGYYAQRPSPSKSTAISQASPALLPPSNAPRLFRTCGLRLVANARCRQRQKSCKAGNTVRGEQGKSYTAREGRHTVAFTRR